MIRPDVELVRHMAGQVADDEGRRGGSQRAYTLALEIKTLIGYVEFLEKHRAALIADLRDNAKWFHEDYDLHAGLFEDCGDLGCVWALNLIKGE